MAGSFAQSNKKTLLIDCDLRRPRIHTIVGADKKPGLVDHLTNNAKLDDIIRVIKPTYLSYITSGSIPLKSGSDIRVKINAKFSRKYSGIF